MGNSIFVNIAASAPRFIVINGYPIVATAQGALTAIPSSPVHRGDTVVVYALGMGQTVPPVTSGQAAPTAPLAVTSPTAQICLGGQNGPFAPPPTCTTALFSGLTPGFVGLYQINVTIPPTAPTGNTVPVYIQSGSAASTVSQIAIQ